jgi:hypothetical protein
MMTSESAARKFFVRAIEGSPFSTENSGVFLFKNSQLPENIMADLKNGVGVIAYPECDGTEGSCVPPQISAMADRLGLRLHMAPLKYFQADNGVRLVGMRAVKKLTHNNHELYIANGTKGVTVDDSPNVTGTASTDCKLKSENVNVKDLLEFFSYGKIPKSNFVSVACSGKGTGKDVKGIIVPIK